MLHSVPDLATTIDSRISEYRNSQGLAGDRSSGKARLSFKSNFIWIFSGNAVYALCQWGMIVILAKFGSSFMVGQFSLGLAIATPILMFSNLQLRSVQATDAKHSYNFSEYLHLRILTTATAFGMILGIVALTKYEHRTALVILAVAVTKSIDALSDIHYGLFQQHDRLNDAGASMMLRGILSLLALSTGIYITHDVIWGCVGVAIAWLFTLFLFDARRAAELLQGSTRHLDATRRIIRKETQTKVRDLRRHWYLARLAFPLGIVTTIAAVNLNVPRYFIHAKLGEYQLGIFSAMAYTTVAMTLVSDSLSHSGVPKMSRLYADRCITEFLSLLFRLIISGVILGLVALTIANFAGPQLLTVLYGKEYAAQSNVFTLLILAAAINSVGSAFTTGITSARCFRIQVPLFAFVILVCIVACTRWVPRAGLLGGALAMVCSALTRLILSAATLGYLLRDRLKARLQLLISRCGLWDRTLS